MSTVRRTTRRRQWMPTASVGVGVAPRATATSWGDVEAIRWAPGYGTWRTVATRRARCRGRSRCGGVGDARLQLAGGFKSMHGTAGAPGALPFAPAGGSGREAGDGLPACCGVLRRWRANGPVTLAYNCRRVHNLAGMTGPAELGVFATHQRRKTSRRLDGQDTVPVSVEAALPAQRHRASFKQVPSRFHARLPRLSDRR